MRKRSIPLVQIMALLLLLLTAMVFAGCKRNTNDGSLGGNPSIKQTAGATDGSSFPVATILIGQIRMSGSILDNETDFSEPIIPEDEDSLSDLSKAVLQSITYDIISIDKPNMKADIIVSVPLIKDEFKTIIDSAINENPTMQPEELITLVEARLTELLLSNEAVREEHSFTLDITYVDGATKIVPSSEIGNLIIGQLEELAIELYNAMWEGYADEFTNQANCNFNGGAIPVYVCTRFGLCRQRRYGYSEQD